MIRMRNGGIIRLAATEVEAKRYESLGFKRDEANPDTVKVEGDFSTYTLDELKEYAEKHEIPLGNATAFKTVLKKVEEGVKKQQDEAGDRDGEGADDGGAVSTETRT